MFANIPLILFAKAPIAGQVKTRLTSHCSDQQAADIASLLIEASIEKALKIWPGQVMLSAAIDIDHPFFKEMTSRYNVSIIQQCDGHLGEKMRHALHGCGYPAAVMGCDAPHVSTESLRQTHRLLAQGQSVIGPADDGGYYMLGLSEPADALFEDKAWGTDQVLNLTLEAAQEIGCSLNYVSALNDVDEWPDLISAASQVSSLQQYLIANGLV